MDKISIRKSEIGQFENGLGVFADKNFKKGETVIVYHLRPLTPKEYKALASSEKQFVYVHKRKKYLYSVPERFVNHSSTPNTYQDLEQQCDIALRNIKLGEEITTDARKDNI